MDTEYLRKLKEQVATHGDMSANDKGIILSLIAEIGRLRATTKEHPVCEWADREPPKPFRGEWFIAETIWGDRVVLRALPEDFSYDYKTADGTYIKADKIKRWMQFPDSQFIPYNLREGEKIVEVAEIGQLRAIVAKLPKTADGNP